VNIRAVAGLILNALPPGGHNYESVIERNIEALNLPSSDREMVYLLVKSVIQYRRLLDYIIDLARIKRNKHLENVARNLLRLGVLQSVVLRLPRHAAVNETVAATHDLKRHDLAGVVNAILRHLPEEKTWRGELNRLEPPAALAIEYSHPEWLVQKWINDFGLENTATLLRFNNEYQPIFFRHNPLRINWPDLEKVLTEQNYQVVIYEHEPVHIFNVDRPGDLLSSFVFGKGYCAVQDYSQSLAVRLLDPHPGETILDACAAPGGKTTLIAQLTDNKAHIVANDRSAHKLELIKESACRLGIDSLNYSMNDASIAKFPLMDKILVDAPCSGTGILARRADLRWNRQPEDLKTLLNLQMRILENVSGALREKGILVYSTCSLEKEENWGTVHNFLERHPEFQVDPADKYIDERYCDELGAVRILPFIHNLTGSFAVRLIKTRNKN
jgi:16S rRNA (cytosine967-C5)-methyltransferase